MFFPLLNSKTASICLGLTFSYPIFEAASRVKAESAIVCRPSIARSPYREFSLWLRHQLTFLSVSVHSRTLTNSHIGYVPDPFPSVTQCIKWPADGWGLVYETSNTIQCKLCYIIPNKEQGFLRYWVSHNLLTMHCNYSDDLLRAKLPKKSKQHKFHISLALSSGCPHLQTQATASGSLFLWLCNLHRQ